MVFIYLFFIAKVMESAEKPKKILSREEEFVQDMIERANKQPERTELNQTKEDPDEIEKLTEALKKRAQQR